MFNEEIDQSIYEPILPPWIEHAPKEIYNSLEDGQIPHSYLDEIIDSAFTKISQNFDWYQLRESQINMSKLILRSFYANQTAVVEAGTGIGKSFAYLVASIAFSYLTGQRVCVSTETKNLQMQLFEKDILFLQTLLAPKLNYALALGSGNYACQLRYQESLDMGSLKSLLSPTESDVLRTWAYDAFDGKHDGSRYDLAFSSHTSFWSAINRDADGCPANKCSFFSNCNYYRARKRWSETRVLVVNHHLLLLHFLNDKKTLPPYGAVVIDEAHGVLKTGYSIFSLTFSQNSLADTKKQYDRALRSLSTGMEFFNETESQWNNLSGKWTNFFSMWEVELDLFGKVDAMQVIEKKVNIPVHDMVMLTEELKEKIASLLEDNEDSTVQNNLRAVQKFFDRLLRFASHFSTVDTEKKVFWGEKKNSILHLHSCNLRLSEEFSNYFDEPQLWTSATLGFWDKPFPSRNNQEKTEKGYFKNFREEVLPQNDKKVNQRIFDSPFLFEEQALLYIPQNLAVPPYGSDFDIVQRYEEHLSEEIAWLSEMSGGGSMALFTSNYRLNKVAELLEEQTDLEVISQLDYGPNKALELFRENPESILLGSASFWQGVDLAGDSLRMVIITQMMFTRPDDPIFKARETQLKKQNRKAFFELSLPFAGTMLRQAFGRLIRSETDTGVVALLDSRLLQKSYGKTLIVNLPTIKKFHERNSLSKEVDKREFF